MEVLMADKSVHDLELELVKFQTQQDHLVKSVDTLQKDMKEVKVTLFQAKWMIVGALVVAGIMIGNRGRALAMSETTREHLDTFWELLDEILNAVLFVLIGFELLILTLKAPYLIAGLLAIPTVLLSRLLSVGLPMSFLRVRRDMGSGPHAVKVLTWGGLRGGISVALALSLPTGAERDALVVVTYVVVAFSIIVQGLSFGPLLKRLYRSEI